MYDCEAIRCVPSYFLAYIRTHVHPSAFAGVQVGVALASWINYQSNFIPHDSVELVGSPPYHIKTPDLEWAKLALLRMLIGYSSLFLTRAVSVSYVSPVSYH